jgi:hypothetical protein
MAIARFSAFALFLGALASGCAPDCKRVCHKLIDCGLDSPRTAYDECLQSCESQQALLEDWADAEKLDAFDEQRRCLGRSSCDEIEAGTCYDPELFSF